MKHEIKISSAGNIEPPIYYLIKEKGYKISILNQQWVAEKSDIRFYAENILELAGIILLFEEKGENWKVKDHLVDDYLEFLKKHED